MALQEIQTAVHKICHTAESSSARSETQQAGPTGWTDVSTLMTDMYKGTNRTSDPFGSVSLP